MLKRGGMRQLVSIVLVVGGAAFLVYGLFFHSAVISSAQEADAAVAQAETSLIREVAIGGLKRDASGQIKKTYTGKAPKACPT